jgi:hypothetical protein
MQLCEIIPISSLTLKLLSPSPAFASNKRLSKSCPSADFCAPINSSIYDYNHEARQQISVIMQTKGAHTLSSVKPKSISLSFSVNDIAQLGTRIRYKTFLATMDKELLYDIRCPGGMAASSFQRVLQPKAAAEITESAIYAVKKKSDICYRAQNKNKNDGGGTLDSRRE